MTAEIGLLLAPGATYAALARRTARVTPLTALRRPLLAALVLGGSVAIAATGQVTPALVLSTTVTWSYLVAAQVAIALPLIAAGARRTVGLARALDLFFAAHAPWSLFLLAAAAWSPSPIGRPAAPLLYAAAVPIVLTPRIISAFFREVLEMDPRRAAVRTAIHQAITWGLALALFWIVSALSPRALQFLQSS